MSPPRVRTATRLALAFGGVVIVIAVAGGLALLGVVRGDSARQAQAEREARELELALTLQAAALKAVQASPGEAAAASAFERYAQARLAIQALPPSPQARAALEAVDAAAAVARLHGVPVTVGGWDAVADPAEPVDPSPGARGRLGAAVASAPAWMQALQGHADAVRRAAEAGRQQAQEARATLQRALAAAIVAAGLLAALLGWWAVRGLRRELGTDPGQLKEAAQRLGQGELYHALDRRDARDSVVDAFDRMREALAALALAVRHAAQDTAGSGQHLAAGQQVLRERIDQQAQAVQQALLAVSALGAALKRGADEAQQARDLAEQVQGLAQRGGQAMAQAFDGVRALEAAAVERQQWARAVDGIAFQARLLALNATLEAGRAGVAVGDAAARADEVAALSQRCAELARLLRETPSGGELAAGRALSQLAQADAALQSLDSAAGRMARAAGGLDVWAREQAGSAERIDLTLAQLDQATREAALTAERNAAAAQALSLHSGQLLAALSPLKPLPEGLPELPPLAPLPAVEALPAEEAGAVSAAVAAVAGPAGAAPRADAASPGEGPPRG